MDQGGDALGTAISSAPDRVGKLREAFLELESLRGFASLEWSDLEQDFADKEGEVRRKYQELLEKEIRLDVQAREVLESINKREVLISEKEESLKIRQDSGDEEHQKEVQPMDTDISAAAVNYAPVKREDQEAAAAGTRSVEKSQVRVRPYLKSLCENMDGEGLRRYVVDHRKDMGALRIEMPAALQHATDPARIVLDAVQGYHSNQASETIVANGGANKAVAVNSANRRACILLLEALSSVLGDEPVVPLDIKFLVRELAEEWKSKMDFQDGPDGNSLDAQAFLQLVAAYGLSSEYDEEELCKLVFAVTRRKQTPALCKALKLSHKIPEIVEHLTNDGKQIEALAFAHTFDMMGRIEPVPLLKAYLKDARKNGYKNGGGGSGGVGNHQSSQNDSVTKELAALRNVLKCIEEYNLEGEYPSSPLHRRVAHLERTRSERKRTGGSVKGQAKRARNGGYEQRSFYRPAAADKNQVFNGVSYSLQPAYDSRTAAPAAYTTYAAADGRSRTPQNSYIYSMDGSIYGSPDLFATQSASYNTYQIPPGLPPPATAYQASFMH